MDHIDAHARTAPSDLNVILSGTPKVRRRKAKRLAKKAKRADKRGQGHVDSESAPCRQATKSADPSPLEIVELTSEPDETVLDNVAAVLRDFYEVESASFAMARRGQCAPTPVIALRVHSKYQARVDQIFDTVVQAAATTGVDAEVVLVNGRDRIRSVRANSFVFFPWRRRAVA